MLSDHAIVDIKLAINKTVHKDLYCETRLKLNNLIASSKLSYYDEKILQGLPDQKSLFAFLDKVCHQKYVGLPELQSVQLVASFNDYFVPKITSIHKYLDKQPVPPDLQELDTDEAGSSFATFSPMSVLDVDKIVSSASGAENPISTWILKQCKDELLSHITNTVNHSLSSGNILNSLKNALLEPLIKKSPLNPSEYKSNMMVSNLGFGYITN